MDRPSTHGWGMVTKRTPRRLLTGFTAFGAGIGGSAKTDDTLTVGVTRKEPAPTLTDAGAAPCPASAVTEFTYTPLSAREVTRGTPPSGNDSRAAP